MGPDSGNEYGEVTWGVSVGFGAPLGLNTGTPGTGANNMRVYVRSP